MRRVVVTGMGIVSPLGNDVAAVSSALREGRSGLRTYPEEPEHLRSHVAGMCEIDLAAVIDRKLKRFMGDAATYSYVAMRDAIADAGLCDEAIRCPPRAPRARIASAQAPTSSATARRTSSSPAAARNCTGA